MECQRKLFSALQQLTASKPQSNSAGVMSSLIESTMGQMCGQVQDNTNCQPHDLGIVLSQM